MTGNGPAPPPFIQTTADDIQPGMVDPRLLTSKDPVFDNLSVVTVEAGSCFTVGQEVAGIGVSLFAPKFGRFTPKLATAVSGACQSDDELLHSVLVDVSQEAWAMDSQVSDLQPVLRIWIRIQLDLYIIGSLGSESGSSSF